MWAKKSVALRLVGDRLLTDLEGGKLSRCLPCATNELYMTAPVTIIDFGRRVRQACRY